jgi:hypothetical protein
MTTDIHGTKYGSQEARSNVFDGLIAPTLRARPRSRGDGFDLDLHHSRLNLSE